jgi:S1/P1 Nuclease
MKLHRLSLRVVLLLPFTLSVGCHVSWAWGCKGHQTVALVAEQQLTAEARHSIEKLLTENPVDPQLKRLCGNVPRDLMADASTWPDDVRNSLENGPWHYIDIPRGALPGPLGQFCGRDGCITQAIVDQIAILKDKDAEPHLRADALRYLIHFVGDLHMPLHASTNNDLGGTCVPVRYFRRRPQEHAGAFTPNLHAIWDTAIPERDMQGADPPEYAELLGQIFSSDFPKWQAAGIHIAEWAWESHTLAESVAYGELVPKLPTEVPVAVRSCTDADNIGERLMRLNLFAGQNYQEAAAPVVRRRMAQAGTRLAMILNEAMADGQSPRPEALLFDRAAGALQQNDPAILRGIHGQ